MHLKKSTNWKQFRRYISLATFVSGLIITMHALTVMGASLITWIFVVPALLAASFILARKPHGASETFELARDTEVQEWFVMSLDGSSDLRKKTFPKGTVFEIIPGIAGDQMGFYRIGAIDRKLYLIQVANHFSHKDK